MELKLASWCSSEFNDDADCYVVLRAGEIQRLAKLGNSRSFNVPQTAVSSSGKILGRLDVLKCVSSCSIAVDTKALTPLDLVLPCPAEPAVGDVHISLIPSSTKPLTDVQKTVEENSYLVEHGIQEFLAAAVKAVLRERPGDPRRFIAAFLTGSDAEASRPPSGFQMKPRHSVVSTDSVFGYGPAAIAMSTADAIDVQSMVSELKKLRQHVSRQDAVIDQFHDSISQLVRDQPLTFTVLQYNILARYLGSNMQPWLLYGPDISEERRERVMAKFQEKDVEGNLVNKGWPDYAKGILSEDEIRQVEEVHNRFFDWSVRRDKLLKEVQSSNCDIIAMEEMDEYEDFQEALSKDYIGLFRKRPRKSSKDGCAVFWRRTKFELVDSEGFDFVDRTDKTGTALKDRTCLLVLLRWATQRYGRHESRVLVLCTHLARNPEDPSQTKVRARQAAQLMKHLTEFATRHAAIEVPVVLMGDLNAQHFGEVRGIARTVFQVSGHPCHNFLFRCADVPTGPTSVTDMRKVRIDAVMFQPKHLKVLGIHVPHLTGKIPDEVHPSDHVAVRVKFEVKADHLKMQECARSWLECVTGQARLLPMTDREIKRAFAFLDRDSTNEITKRTLQESILELEMGSMLPPEVQRRFLDCFPNQAITFEEFVNAYKVKFDASRMANIGDLEQAFTFFDSDSDGKVTSEDVHAAFNEIVPVDFTSEEVNNMMSHLTDNWKDGLDVHTFCEALCRCNFSCNDARRPSKDPANENAQRKMEQLRRNLGSWVAGAHAYM